MAKEYYEQMDETSDSHKKEDNTIAISEDAVDIQLNTVLKAYKEQGLDADAEELRVKIQDELVRRKVLYQEALDNGISVNDNEVDTYINDTKAAVKNTSNYNEYLAFVEGFGSEDQYWKEQRELVIKELIIGKYMNILEGEIIQESNLDIKEPEESNEIIEELNTMTDELAEDYEVKIE